MSPSASAAPPGVPVPSPSTLPLPAGTRCGVHPVRRAVDRCPVCSRPRCAADAADAAVAAADGGCPACGGIPPGSASTSGRPLPLQEKLVRAALAAHAVALLGGVVAQQYVEAQLFAYLTPFVVGVLTGAATQAAAGGARRGRDLRWIRLIAVLYAVLGVAYGFVLERSTDVLEGSTVLPYLAAVAGVVLWTLPPKARPPVEEP